MTSGPETKRAPSDSRAGEVPPQSTPPATLSDEPDESMRLALLAAIVESSDDAIVSKTLQGRILSWNAGAQRIFGYLPEEMIGKPITTIIPPELHAEEEQILAKLARGQVVDHFDTTRVTKDGRRIPVSLMVSPVRDAQGRIIGASKIARDISERKRVEQSLLEGERRLGAEAHALAKLNLRCARLWRSRSLDEGVDEMLAAVIELLGADHGNVRLRDGLGGALAAAAEARTPPAPGAKSVVAEEWAEAGAAQQILIEDVTADGPFESLRALTRRLGYRAVISTPLTAADGTSLGTIVAYFHAAHQPHEQQLRRLDLYLRQASDFIERLRLEQGLRQSEEALREADRRKDEFLALLAHELRNPLAPIRYALAAARKPGRTHEQRRRAEEIMERQVAHMSRLLDDLLDISRITRGTLDLKKTRTELTSVVGAAIETARPILDARHHLFSLELPKHAVRLEADPVRLAQAFSNLLINAAKYTNPAGRIELRAEQQSDEVVVTVRDNGIGIAPEMMPRLFRLFSQAHPGLTHAEGGLGVGLALVRGLITLHGGSVEASSAGSGRGSVFTVRLPVGNVQAESPEQDAGAAPRGSTPLKILVVDDNRDAADTCAMVLELSGHCVQTTYSAHAALELGEVFGPDVLVLDIGLPDLDGYRLAQKIRATGWGRDAVLIAVTGWGQEEDRRRALEAGFDHHLTKPIAPEKLEALLQPLSDTVNT
jgi:PAS domain S-box-containing protein